MFNRILSILSISCLILSNTSHADTIGRYMNIANNIPKMEMKADRQAHIWARSARTVLSLTSESIAETLILANATATEHGTPIFCLPIEVSLNAIVMNELIQETYREISSQTNDKNNLTVSNIAWIAVTHKYPCNQDTSSSSPSTPSQITKPTVASMGHMDGVLPPPP
ncbi:MAG: phosphatase [Legionellaceae bacterium]|nr:phosphatase [Legionellaceae bacterium]